MRSRRGRWLALMVMVLCWTNLGCTGLTLGPLVKTEYIVLHPGRPVQILENASLKGRTLDGTGDAVEQDVGGWVAMPMDHWDAVKRALEKKP